MEKINSLLDIYIVEALGSTPFRLNSSSAEHSLVAFGRVFQISYSRVF